MTAAARLEPATSLGAESRSGDHAERTPVRDARRGGATPRWRSAGCSCSSSSASGSPAAGSRRSAPRRRASRTSGRLTGLVASVLMLVQVLLMARIPMVEQAWGQDELARVHRLVGFTSFNLMVAHIVLITLGYAGRRRASASSAPSSTRSLNSPGHAAGRWPARSRCAWSSSPRSGRPARRLRYESWHLLHLYAYLGVGLALPHQLWTGADFTRQHRPPPSSGGALYAAALGRGAGLPGRAAAGPLLPAPPRGRRRRAEESPTVTTRRRDGAAACTGCRCAPGQFFLWRFLDGPGWTRANPYSLSAAPDGRSLRITADARRRRARPAGDAAARHAGARRGTVRPAARRRAGPRARCAHRRRHRHHPDARAARGAAARRPATSSSSTASASRPTSSSRDELVDAGRGPGRPRRRRRRPPRTATAAAGCRPTRATSATPRPCCGWCPTSPSATCSSAAARPGWTPSSRAALDAGVPRDAVHLERFSY